MAFELFSKAQERGERNVYTPIFQVMEEVARKSFMSEWSYRLLDDKKHKLDTFQDFTRSIVSYLIK